MEGILGEMEGADLPQITAKPILKKLGEQGCCWHFSQTTLQRPLHVPVLPAHALLR